MGVSQRLGVRPASIASPTDAHRTVVYPGVLPRVVRRNAKKHFSWRSVCMCGCDQTALVVICLQGGWGVGFSAMTISLVSIASTRGEKQLRKIQ